VLDDGILTDGLGRRIDFKNTVIIMTSNVGVRELKSFGTGVGFSTQARKDQTADLMRSTIQNSMKKVFRPEFLNRIDEIIIFNELEKEDILRIIDLQLKDVFARIEEKGYTIGLSDKAKEFIAEKGFDKQFGARPLQRALRKYLEDPIADAILESHVSEGDHLFVDFDTETEKITVEPREAEKKIESSAPKKEKEEESEE